MNRIAIGLINAAGASCFLEYQNRRNCYRMTQPRSAFSLQKTGYFNVENVFFWRQNCRSLRAGSLKRVSIEMGLAGVLSTQLWHHLFMDSTLADLPGLTLVPEGVTA